MHRLLTPSFLVFSLFIIGGLVFKATSPIQCGTILPNDSIFVLTGDERRIPFAVQKMQEFPNTDLYIIGAGIQGDVQTSEHVIIESESKSTYQNALAIKKIINKKKLKNCKNIKSL